jgi:hypothetical protein
MFGTVLCITIHMTLFIAVVAPLRVVRGDAG